MASLPWDAWIGQETVEENLPPTPPPVLDELVSQSLLQDIELEKRIEEFTSEAVHIPEPKTINDYPSVIALEPILIDGLFRKGRKGILTADSKAGKSFFAIELGLCVASGTPFLGRKCTKSKVCYFNYEIAESEFMDRVKAVSAALKIKEDDFAENFKIIHMRGYSIPLSKMCGNIIALMLQEQKTTGEPFSLIIMDPIYKITNGDENSAKDVGRFCNDLDKIIKESGCSVFYTHHHSKGEQSYKKAADRGSGSGVFARDADLMIDLMELSIDGQTRAALQNNYLCNFWKTKLDETDPDWVNKCSESEKKSSGALASLYQSIKGTDPSNIFIMVMNQQQAFESEMNQSTAFRMEFVVRGFPPVKNQNIIFRYPIHILDKDGILITASPEIHVPGVNKKDTPEVKAQKMEVFVDTVDQLIMSSKDGYTTYAEVAEELDVDTKTITRRLNACEGRYEVEKGGKGRGDVAKIRFSGDD